MLACLYQGAMLATTKEAQVCKAANSGPHPQSSQPRFDMISTQRCNYAPQAP
jgi:hypothetical protein